MIRIQELGRFRGMVGHRIHSLEADLFDLFDLFDLVDLFDLLIKKT
jgi:hypothetical protein